MKDILTKLNLTDDTIEIFLECMGKVPLSYEEIHAIKPHLSDDEFRIIFDELVKNKLIVNVVPEGSTILDHYLAIPPFSAIIDNIISSNKENKNESSELKSKLKEIIRELFKKKENSNALISVLNELKMMKQNFDNDSSELRKEIHSTLDSMQTRDDSALYYLNFEENVKKSINSQFASILEIILQIDAQSEEIPGIKDLAEEQWSKIRQDLKNYLAKKVHEKAMELDNYVSDNFREIKDYFGSKLAISMEEQIGQRAVDLGILKIIIEELSGLHDFIISKNQEYNENLENIIYQINEKISGLFEEFINENVENIHIFENLLPEILETYFNIDNNWQILSIPKIRDEISNLIKHSDGEIVIMVPKINDFIPLQKIKNYDKSHDIIIIASDPHESEIVNEINTYPGVKYLKIDKNKEIGIKGAGILILGYYKLNPKDLSKKVNAIGTIDQNLINILSPIMDERIKLAKPPVKVQMNTNFNAINTNIDILKGSEIGKLLQENLDIATTIKGISLNVLELKLLISKLKGIENRLEDAGLRNNIIKNIQAWNEEFTSLPLKIDPNLEMSDLKDQIMEGETIKEITTASEVPSDDFFEKFDLEKVNPLFEILFDKIENTKGEDLSNMIQDVINTMLQIQGYSIITTWKDELASDENKDKILEKEFREKFVEDFTRWKEIILHSKDRSRVESKEPETLSSKQYIKEGDIGEKKIELGDYVSPGLAQEQNLDQTADIREQIDDKIKNAFENISSNFTSLNGLDISNKLQVLGDLLVEKHGYMATKNIRPWISKLKKFKDPLDTELIGEISNFLNDIKEKFVGTTDDGVLLEYEPSFANIENSNLESEIEQPEKNKLLSLFNKVLEDSTTLKGYELTGDLQEIADFLMQTKGSLSARSIRPWISKLRSIREPLEEDIKDEFAKYIEDMKEMFC